MNLPESVVALQHLQTKLHATLIAMRRPMTLAEIQYYFAGRSGETLAAALDALVAAGAVERLDNPSPLVPLFESLPRYQAVRPEGGLDHA